MKTLTFVWGFIAFSILGLEIFTKTETFDALQDFESNFNITGHPDEFLPNWSANEIRATSSRVFQAAGEGVNQTQALGIQPISSFNAEIYIKTTSIGLESTRISLQAKTKRNGSGNRPVYVFYSFSVDQGNSFTENQIIGDLQSFQNEDSPYEEYEFFIPDTLMENTSLQIKLEVHYGEGQGSAARLFIDDFTIHGLAQEEFPVLKIDSVGINGEKSLIISFNQSIAMSPETGDSSIVLNQGYGGPVEITVEGKFLKLEFSDYLYSNHYELTLNHITAEDGTDLGIDTKHKFEIFSPTPPGTIILNEFMADPNPKRLIPENPVIPSSATHEYIELYNVTDKPVRLKGFTLNGVKLEDVTLTPDTFALLTPLDNRQLFIPFGQVIGVDGFKSLANAGGHISLKDSFDSVVDSLSYTQDWYADLQKINGGWALERINPFLNCSGQDNWKASNSPQGGTPGKSNSVFDPTPDTLAFVIIQVLPLSSREIKVGFSKAIHPYRIKEADFFWGDTILVVKDFFIKELVLTLPEEMVHNTNYTLEIHNLVDCTGLELQNTLFSFNFDLEPPKILRVAGISPEEISVHFNKPILKNISESEENYRLDQEQNPVKSAQSIDSLGVLLMLNKPLELDKEYSLSIANLEDEIGNVSKEVNFTFVFDDLLDTVIMSGTSILELHFKTEVDSLSTSLIQNYSVGDNIGHPRTAYRNAENSRIVHLIFDRDLPQNKSNTLTVQDIRDLNGNFINTLRKSFFRDTRPLTVIQVKVENDSSLSVHFNKPLFPDFVEINTNYLVNENIGHPVEVILINPHTVTLQFSKKFMESKIYKLSIQGLRDIFGVDLKKDTQINFDFDPSLPEIVISRLINPYEILLVSNTEIILPIESKVNISNHKVSGIRTINETEFLLTTLLPITQDQVHILILGLTDTKGNTADSISINLPNDKIYLGEATIIQENRIRLSFSAEIDPETALKPENYSVNNTPPLEVLAEEKKYEILLHLNNILTLKDSVTVEIKTIKSIGGKQNQGLLQKLWYDDGIQDLYAINSQLIQLIHDEELEKSSVEEAVFQLKDQEVNIRPLVNQTDPRVVQLILDQPLTPNIIYELSIPPRYSIDGKLISGSLRPVIWDQSPPKLLMIEPLNQSELLLSFDEPLDPILLLVPSFYRLGESEPIEVIPGELPHQVILVFGEVLQKDNTYQILVTQLEDLNRNAIKEESLTFVFEGPVSPGFKEIVINEVMPAPRAGNELPDAEYIELFNSGENEVFLGGLSLSNSRSNTVLPRETMMPGTYVILTSNHHQAALEPFGKTLGLSPWPTLLNEGDDLALMDAQGKVLDALSYQTSNYGDSEKAEGGYSLEVVNPFSFCPEASNLIPSQSSQRGTPGTINSVFDDTPDQSPFILLKASPIDLNFIEMKFSKILNEDLEQVEIYGTPPLVINSLSINEGDPSRLIVELQEPFQENQQYNISIDKLLACDGNLIDPEGNSAKFKIPVDAEIGDIHLNEVLFNPKTGGPKFIEIYNRSDKFISLSSWKLANASNGIISQKQNLSFPDLIIDPQSFMVFTTDSILLKTEYPKGKPETFLEIPDLPSYPIARGSVIFMNPGEDLVEWFDYDEKFHHPLLNDVKGISLERYSLDHEVNDPNNWHSASSPEGYATPGHRNSQVNELGILEKGISISPKVFVPDAPGEQNFTTINYEMNQPGLVGTLRIYSVNGQLIKELCQNETWGISGFYTWDGTDQSGRRVRTGYYVVWVEVINLEGRVENIKKTVVVGAKF